MTVAAGFYKRALPSPPAVDFSSPEGKNLFMEALANGNMEGFFNLISHFVTQSEPAYCGLATLAMVLNALSIDPCRQWKGPWRWFDETMLDWCEPLEKVKVDGISFGKVVCLAHCAGANVEAYRTDESSVDEFRRLVVMCSTLSDTHLVSSYHRKAFKQTGTGHFSPIGGYHASTDMVLILDVARFKYPPHWVPLELLWEAMDTMDEATRRRRGFMVLSRRQRRPALLHTMSCKHESWITTAKYLMDDVPLLLSCNHVDNIDDVVSIVSSSLPSRFTDFTDWVCRKDYDHDTERLSTMEEVLKLVRETSLYKHVSHTLSSQSDDHDRMMDLLTALLLALPPRTWSTAIEDHGVLNEIRALVSLQTLPSLLQDEVLHLRGQLLALKICTDDRVHGDQQI